MRHLLWLWLWFFIGALMYWLKRAYYLVTGPNPIASNYKQFWVRCWIPLLVRFFIESLVFWALFTPGFADKALAALGWTNFSWVVSMVTQFAVFAGAFGHTLDSIMDFAVSKVPYINSILPQMPGPLATGPAKP
jgi:hypothetical protein